MSVNIKNVEDVLSTGFTWENDRYKFAQCARDPQATRLALCLEQEAFHHIPAWVRGVLYARIDQLYPMIPVRILVVRDEPYFSCEEMSKDVRENNVIKVRHRGGGHLGQRTQRFRAIHDYFGHVVPDNPFTFSGELGAYLAHVEQFPVCCRPYVRSNVVLENAYRLNRGHFLCYPRFSKTCPAKVVFDIEHFGPERKFYDAAMLRM